MVLNFYFYFLEIIYKLDCGYNFIPFHCKPFLNCESVKTEGPKIIHGIAGRFVGGKRSRVRNLLFEEIYKTIDRVENLRLLLISISINIKTRFYYLKYTFTNSWKRLVLELKEKAKNLPQKKCARYSDLILKPLLNANIR